MEQNLMNVMDALKYIVYKEKEGMVQITLNRPPGNVFHVEMVEEINQALAGLLYNTHVKVVVFLAAGKNFCAGVDPQDFQEDRTYQLIEALGRMYEQLQTLNIPVLSLVQGAALGAGFELVMFSDLAIATESSTFGLPQIKMGLIPAFACNMLQRCVPPKKAAELIFTGDTISAKEALAFGLLNQVVPDDKLGEQGSLMVRRLLQHSAPVLQMAKKSMTQASGQTLDEAIRIIEEIYLNELMSLEDAAEGIRAIAENRKPVWRNE